MKLFWFMNAVIWIAAFVNQSTWFTNATICITTLVNQSAWFTHAAIQITAFVNQNSLIYECSFTFSRIRKSFFTLNFEARHTQFQTLFLVFAFVSRSHSEVVSFCYICIPFVQCKFLELSFFLFIFTNISINVFRFSYICFFPCIGGLEALFRWLTFVFLTFFGFSHCSVLFHCLRGFLWIFWFVPLLIPCPPSLLLPPPLLALPWLFINVGFTQDWRCFKIFNFF